MQLRAPAQPVAATELPFEPSAEVSLLMMDAILEGPASLLWGRIGELYVAERLGVALSKCYAQGHDGHLGNELVEVKTITRTKKKIRVRVKTAGNFSVLVVVRVTDDYELQLRRIERSALKAPPGAEFYFVDWDHLKRCA